MRFTCHILTIFSVFYKTQSGKSPLSLKHCILEYDKEKEITRNKVAQLLGET